MYLEQLNLTDLRTFTRSELTFLHPDHESHAKFARLTKQEEQHELLTDTASIGTRAGWEARLRERGLKLKGHRVVKDAAEKAEG